MRFVRTAALLVGSLGAAITKASAGAATFDWTLSVPSNVTSGGFTYTGSLTATMTGTPGVYIINSMTGEVNGNSVSLLAPGSFEGNSNQLLLNQPFLLGSNGFSLLVASIGDINVFTFGGNGSGNDWGEFGPTGAFAGVGVLQVAQTPLPAALPLFASGLGAIGFVGRLRKRMRATRPCQQHEAMGGLRPCPLVGARPVAS
jgi:hypothetical protein